MAYTGSGLFDNDDAFDWLNECSEKNIILKIKSILKKMVSYELKLREKWPDGKIENYINRVIDSWSRNGAGKGFEESKLTYDEYILKFQDETRDRLKAGIFLTSEYGPVEQSLAAIGLIALAIDADVGSIAGSEYEMVIQRASWLKSKSIKKDLVELAILALERILNNSEYSKERRWWLDFEKKRSEDWDHMLPLKKLKTNLEIKLKDF